MLFDKAAEKRRDEDRKNILKDQINVVKKNTSGRSSRSFLFFLLLVGQSICTQAFFKLSQQEGVYNYNTKSAMAVIEFVKFTLSLTQVVWCNNGNFEACVETFRGVKRQVYLSYMFLAASYAVYNQSIFYVMTLVDPGTFGLLKSFSPGVVALINFTWFGRRMTKSQVLCLMIQIFGIVPVTATPTKSGIVQVHYGVLSIMIMTIIVFFGAFNTVFNASVVKSESLEHPVHVQNSILYTFGFFCNMLFYCATRRPDNNSFFSGYRNFNVLVVILLNSTAGITVSMVYKYGDAVLKTLAQPVVSAILLFLSNILFNIQLDIIKVSGAGTVILSTMLYLSLPPPRETAESSPVFSFLRTRKCRLVRMKQVGIVSVLCVASLGQFASGTPLRQT